MYKECTMYIRPGYTSITAQLPPEGVPLIAEFYSRVLGTTVVDTEVRGLTLNSYTYFDYKKALLLCHNIPEDAAKYLTDGSWRSAKLISWNQASLDTKTKELETLTALNATQCRKVLMDCAGNFELARLKLTTKL